MLCCAASWGGVALAIRCTCSASLVWSASDSRGIAARARAGQRMDGASALSQQAHRAEVLRAHRMLSYTNGPDSPGVARWTLPSSSVSWRCWQQRRRRRFLADNCLLTRSWMCWKVLRLPVPAAMLERRAWVLRAAWRASHPHECHTTCEWLAWRSNWLVYRPPSARSSRPWH